MKANAALINPLSFIAVDYPSPDGSTNKPTLEEVMGFLCPPETPSDIDSLVKRYRKISQVQPRLLFPDHPRTPEKIVWPLRQAIASYMVGNYLAVIALCGMVAEMVAIRLWNHEDLAVDEKKEFGRKFHDLLHSEKIKILFRHKIITKENKHFFDDVRDTRNKYLHKWSKDHRRLPRDAIRVYRKTVRLVEISLGAQGFQDGAARLPGRLLRYLKKHGRVD